MKKLHNQTMQKQDNQGRDVQKEMFFIDTDIDWIFYYTGDTTFFLFLLSS